MINTALLFLNTNKYRYIFKDTPFFFTTIAGVPLISRVILSLQKSGITRIIIFGGRSHSMKDKIKTDERIKIDIEWRDISTNALINVIKKNADKENILILEGNTIPNHHKLAGVLKSFVPKKVAAVTQISYGMSVIQRGFKIEERDCASILNGLSQPCSSPLESDLTIGNILDLPSIKDAESSIYNSLINPCTGFLEKHLCRRVSIQITKGVINTDITPNQLTIISTLVGFVSLCFFLSPDRINHILGSLIFIFSTILDCTDGEVARVKFQESKYGSILDIICDNLVQIPLFFAISYGIYAGGVIGKGILTAGMAAAFGSTMSFLFIFYNMMAKEKTEPVSSSAAKLSPIENRDYGLGKFLDNFVNRDFGYIMLICSIIGHMEWFVIATAIGSNILWLAILVKKIGASLSAKTLGNPEIL